MSRLSLFVGDVGQEDGPCDLYSGISALIDN